jgi:hypothetical protein
MSDDGSPEGTNESGTEFRQKFEATQAENRALREVVASQIAESHSLVKPEDLAGVDAGELSARAAEIQSSRHAEQQELVRSGLQGLGWSEERIQQEMAGSVPAAPQPVSHSEALGNLGGTPVSRSVDYSDLSPGDKIAAGIAANRKR